MVKKRKFIKKLKAKKFYNFRLHFDVIQTVFNEELKPYKDEIIDLKEEKERLNKCTLENYFDNLPKKKKEDMIALSPSYRDIEIDESSFESLSENINFIINLSTFILCEKDYTFLYYFSNKNRMVNKPLNELKNKIRFYIRNFIINKIKEIKLILKKTI